MITQLQIQAYLQILGVKGDMEFRFTTSWEKRDFNTPGLSPSKRCYVYKINGWKALFLYTYDSLTLEIEYEYYIPEYEVPILNKVKEHLKL